MFVHLWKRVHFENPSHKYEAVYFSREGSSTETGSKVMGNKPWRVFSWGIFIVETPRLHKLEARFPGKHLFSDSRDGPYAVTSLSVGLCAAWHLTEMNEGEADSAATLIGRIRRRKTVVQGRRETLNWIPGLMWCKRQRCHRSHLFFRIAGFQLHISHTRISRRKRYHA